MKIKKQDDLDEKILNEDIGKNKPYMNSYTWKDYLKPGFIGSTFMFYEIPISIVLGIEFGIEYSIIPQTSTYILGRVVEAYIWKRDPIKHNKNYYYTKKMISRLFSKKD